MRMWIIDPRLLCRQHLLGEHNEIHKFRPSFVKQHNMQKRIEQRQIFPHLMKQRHDELVEEMLRRGYNHNTPYVQPSLYHIKEVIFPSTIDVDYNMQEFELKCLHCGHRQYSRPVY